MPAKKVVYDLSGDEPVALERFSVVANELVASDPKRFAFEVPSKAKSDEDDGGEKHKGKHKK